MTAPPVVRVASPVPQVALQGDTVQSPSMHDSPEQLSGGQFVKFLKY